jgi:hypothetical protein
MPYKKYYKPKPRSEHRVTGEVAGVRVSDDMLAERDRRLALDSDAAADDPNVALGFTPPPHRSALAHSRMKR